LNRAAPSNAFDQYLLDIRKLPMIEDPKEEIRLAKRARKGDQTRSTAW
jgi:RNA polymerase primary sigma factor